MSKMISLTKGKYALVDDEDFEWLSQWKWYCDAGGYSARNEGKGHNHKLIYMHRQIMNSPIGMETDHVNGSKSDNRRINLRICTISENQANSGIDSKNTSGFKGVYWHKGAKKWVSYIKVNGKYIYLGLFVDPMDAALSYDKAAKQYFGEFAKLNFPDK